MSQSIWYLYNDILLPEELHVVEGLAQVGSGLESSPTANVIATYSVDNDYDFGSITIEDTILEMYEDRLRTTPGVHKLTDGFYTRQSQFRVHKEFRAENPL